MEAEGWSTALRALLTLRKLTIIGLYANADGQLQDAADALPPSDRALVLYVDILLIMPSEVMRDIGHSKNNIIFGINL